MDQARSVHLHPVSMIRVAFRTVAVALVLAGCNGGSGDPPTTPVDNASPVADAGSDQQVQTGTLVIIDGSASYDPDGDRITYSWELVSGPAGSSADVKADNDNDKTAELTPDKIGDYVVRLTVTDFGGAQNSTTVTISAAGAPPVANAGLDRGVEFTAPSTVVQLDGSASYDPSGLPLSYAWQITSFVPSSGQPPAVEVTLSNATTATPFFTVVDLDQLGVYTVSLTVDNGASTSSDQVVITVATAPPPVANAGDDQNVTFVIEGVTVNLDGTASSDPSSLPLSYAWQIVNFQPESGQPPASLPVLINPETATPSFDVTALDQLGTYTIQLTVNNGTLPANDLVLVTVSKAFPATAGMLGTGLMAAAALAARRWRRRKGGTPGHDDRA